MVFTNANPAIGDGGARQDGFCKDQSAINSHSTRALQVARLIRRCAISGAAAEALAPLIYGEAMIRQRLPNRRAVDFEHAGQRYTAAISRFPSGDIAEVFLTSGKYGAAVHLHAQDSAILCSLALQFGVPVETILHAVKGPIGRALELFADPR